MSFTYYNIKDEDLSGKLKNDDSMIDYVYGPEPSKIWWRDLWTAPYWLLILVLKLIYIHGLPKVFSIPKVYEFSLCYYKII